MPTFTPTGPILLLLAGLALAGCDTAEQRAEAYYQRGMALLAEGETDRALVEFRNVFRLNGDHIPARLAYADIQRDRGEIRDAFGQYLRVAETDPANLEGRRAVTELALRAQDFATAKEHADAAFALAPQDPAIRALKATVDFRDTATRDGAIEMAQGVLAEAPDTVAAHMVLIADRINAGAPREALPLIETALNAAPGDENLHLVRLAALEQLGDTAGSGAELRRMAELFPDNAAVRQALIQWHLRAGDPDGAEAVVRGLAARDQSDAQANTQAALTVVRFLLEIRGPAAARAELEARIAAATDPRPFQHALAGLDFAEGREAEAIAALRALLEGQADGQTGGAEASDATRDLQVALAQMLADTGQTEESAALLAAVLAGDGNNVEALKLRAKMAIDADKPAQAIQDMRTASTSAPRDPEIMTIMALAHEREGSRELAGERLAMAIEVSNQGPEESLRYARFLMRDKRAGPAEGVVVDALRRAPGNPDLLLMLGEIHLERRDWARAGQVVALLRDIGDRRADAMAASLETASLRGQGRTADVIATLESLAGPDGGDGATGGAIGGAIDGAAMANLMRSYVEAGDLDAAERYLDGALAQDPASLGARLMRAGLDQLRGDPAAAEALYRAVISDAPALPQAHQALYALLTSQGRTREAKAALDAGLKAAPDSSALLFTKAGFLETTGDIDGAIAAYETLYARDSASPLIANNLASLITSYRDDAASLERAFAIARRLRGSDVPYFQDTYGWILHRRGDDEQALSYLEPAAKALPDNALVQFHLAETEFALNRTEAARASYDRALAAAEAGSPLPQAGAARRRITEIDTPAAVPAPASKG